MPPYPDRQGAGSASAFSNGAPGWLLDACPRCDYSLQGLPVEHRCPECGLEIDRESKLFRPQQLPWRVISVLWGLPAVALLSLAVVAANWYAAGWGLLFGANAALYRWRGTRRPCAILVSPRSIQVLGRGPDPLRIPMADVASAERRRVTGFLKFRGNDGHVLLTLSSWFLGSSRIADKVVKAVRQVATDTRNRRSSG